MAQHFITKCSCGNIIAQCRCPSRDKALNIVERGCEICHKSNAMVSLHGNGEWRIQDASGRYVMLTYDDWKHVEFVVHEHYHGED